MLDKYIIKKNKDSTVLINKYDSNEMYFFDGTAKLILDNISLPKKNVIKIICNIYNVSENIASDDYDSFIKSLHELNNVEEKEVEPQQVDKIFSSGIIKMCTIEITNVCPFRCNHCYVPKTKKQFMKFKTFKKIISDLEELNNKSIAFTGGDPLINPDFRKMYKYAKEKGFMVFLNTTLFCLNDNIYKLFNKYKPNGIEVSLYGYNNETYKSFTHTDKAYDNVTQNIVKLKNCGIKISAKTVLTKNNYTYINNLKELAKKLGIDFRYDYIVFPKINEIGCKNSESLTPDEIIDVLKKDDEDVAYFRNAVKEIKEKEKDYKPNKQVFQCGLGNDRIFIDVNGNVKLCLVLNDSINIYDASISSIINELGSNTNKLKFNKNNKCYTCHKKKLCRYCPGRFYLETKSYTIPPDFYCELADKLIEEFGEID